MSWTPAWCSSHMIDLRAAMEKRGIWRFANPERAPAFLVRWVRGTALPEEIDPVAVTMLELAKKALRMGASDASPKCPVCAISRLARDHSAEQKVIDGQSDVALGLMIRNGRVSGSLPEYKPELPSPADDRRFYR